MVKSVKIRLASSEIDIVQSDKTSRSIENMIAVDIHTFRDSVRDIGFDVYLKLSNENLAHVFSRATGLDYKRLAQYIQKGITKLYIHKDDESAYQAFVARPAYAVFNDPATSPEKKIATLLNMTEQNMSELFSQINVREETAESTKLVIRGYVELMTKNPHTMVTILKLVSHGDYLYYHSIAVAIFSLFIAKASGQFNRQTLEFVGLGGFLHDIGSTQLSKDIVCSPENLDAREWGLIHEHPKIGLKMLEDTLGIPKEVRYIVYQHHEYPNGLGYPNQLAARSIYYPAKVVSLADSFSALISKRPFRQAYRVEDALRIIVSESGKFDPELVRIICSVFSQNNTGNPGTREGKAA
jgi:putative nucleotidyltransferase with HDIG domain